MKEMGKPAEALLEVLRHAIDSQKRYIDSSQFLLREASDGNETELWRYQGAKEILEVAMFAAGAAARVA